MPSTDGQRHAGQTAEDDNRTPIRASVHSQRRFADSHEKRSLSRVVAPSLVTRPFCLSSTPKLGEVLRALGITCLRQSILSPEFPGRDPREPKHA